MSSTAFLPTAMARGFARFIAGERGAITVDYVVLTAAACGVAIACSDQLRAGLDVVAGVISTELSSGGQEENADGSLTYSDRFDNGASGWNGATVSKIFGIGNALGPIAGSGGAASVTRDFEMMDGLEATSLTFDVLALDSLDGESGYIYLGDIQVGKITSRLGETSFEANEVEGVDVSFKIIDQNTQLGGSSIDDDWYKDSRTEVTISVTDPSAFKTDEGIMTFGFGSDANQGVEDESFALDNFTVTGLKDPDAEDPEPPADSEPNYINVAPDY